MRRTNYFSQNPLGISIATSPRPIFLRMLCGRSLFAGIDPIIMTVSRSVLKTAGHGPTPHNNFLGVISITFIIFLSFFGLSSVYRQPLIFLRGWWRYLNQNTSRDLYRYFPLANLIQNIPWQLVACWNCPNNYEAVTIGFEHRRACPYAAQVSSRGDVFCFHYIPFCLFLLSLHTILLLSTVCE